MTCMVPIYSTSRWELIPCIEEKLHEKKLVV